MERKKEAKSLKQDLSDQLKFLDELGAGFVFRDDQVKKAPEAGEFDLFPAQQAASLEELNKMILECTKCPLSSLRNKAVPGEGDPKAELMFVGEAPGRDEDLSGRPFVGRAGQLLRKIIAAMKFGQEEVFITNVVKCRPPENRVPNREEIRACSPFLESQIGFVRPKVIVTLGKTPTDYFIPGEARSMGAVRGRFFDYKGIKVVPTFHPSYLVRNEWNRELKKQVWQDMQKVMEFLGRK